ncbi:hypothetical protein PQS31_15685 [Luteimonas sp BLCC-B24]|uniref:hypothetical protein n=1 Tax=Luteimonas sp. BLCC-B24 TaxID=3025317 RepID=UPI00234E04AA|nr:hypothetical protein [Luteimonas sp. BLCC-B24]MDC7808257.1 hypothetical protein [Luteimonas sp. BLCC-B24]
MKEAESVFASLSSILRRHTDGMSIKVDEPGNLYIERLASAPGAKPAFFGAVQTKKSYVSYHLMPIYEHPALLSGLSERLRGRMQGKSCFNFVAPDPVLFAELDALTARCAAGLE